ncbi:MAG TPA: DUF6382 domain-containing protein [Bacillota bacterium]|nr:DUF6382 domain-containing protein [Bacillota bacterium]
MNKDSGLSFEYGYENDSNYSYLVLKINDYAKLLNHQIEIICQNPNPAFVPFHIRRENDNTRIYYNITSKISLAQYLERKTLNRKELLDLLRNIIKNLMLHSNYLLDLSGFIIDLDFIYINPATAEVSLVYTPSPGGRDIMKVLSIFLKDLVVNSANVDDDSNDNYIQRILSYLKSDLFSLYDFNRLIVDLRNSGGLYEYREWAAKEESEASIGIHNSEMPKDKAYKHNEKNRNIRSIVQLQLFIITVAAALCLFMVSRKTGDGISISGVLIIAGALDVLAMRRITAKVDEGTMAGKGRQETINQYDIPTRKEMRSNMRSHNDVQSQPRNFNKEGLREGVLAHNALKAYDTVMITDISEGNHPFLEGVGENIGERIIINKDKFIIGRLDSMVDYAVQDNTIGKLHAEISVTEGNYYVRDLNSKNGTYINNVRIPSNKEWEIKGNDRVRLSNYEYIFRQREVQ